MSKKISIVGGSGFVGTNLCQSLSDQQIPFEIIDIKRSKRFPEKCKIGDIRDINSLRATVSGDIMVNLAAIHRDDVRDKNEYHETNVIGSDNIAKICTERGIQKVVFTSSVAVYGFAKPGTGEDGKINPFNEYGKTKFLAEEKLRNWQIKTGSSLTIIRPTVIFGEGNRGNVYNLLNQIASGRFIMVGNGHNRKSMAYIGNIVAFLMESINSKEPYGLYNYVDNPDLDMNTLVQLVRRILLEKNGVGPRIPYGVGIFLGYSADCISYIFGKNLPISSIRVKKFCSSTEFSSSKSELNNFSAPFTINEGLSRTLHSEFKSPNPEREIFYTE